MRLINLVFFFLDLLGQTEESCQEAGDEEGQSVGCCYYPFALLPLLLLLLLLPPYLFLFFDFHFVSPPKRKTRNFLLSPFLLFSLVRKPLFGLVVFLFCGALPPLARFPCFLRFASPSLLLPPNINEGKEKKPIKFLGVVCLVGNIKKKTFNPKKAKILKKDE
jgi:hypothetical protein